MFSSWQSGTQLAERDAPQAGPGQLLVDVAAAGVNFYPLDQAARAHADLGARRATGKLLLLPR